MYVVPTPHAGQGCCSGRWRDGTTRVQGAAVDVHVPRCVSGVAAMIERARFEAQGSSLPYSGTYTNTLECAISRKMKPEMRVKYLDNTYE